MDVFLLDSDFKIVRPIRYYRKGLHLLRPEPADREFHTTERVHEVALPQDIDCASAMGSITSKITGALHIGRQSTPNAKNRENKPPRPEHVRHDSASSGSSFPSNFSPSAMLDPSTHIRPFPPCQPQQRGQEQSQQQNQTSTENGQRKRRKRAQDVSKHTFYVENSQMRLKLFARNEVSA